MKDSGQSPRLLRGCRLQRSQSSYERIALRAQCCEILLVSGFDVCQGPRGHGAAGSRQAEQALCCQSDQAPVPSN
jgi:hypothetical protein